LAAATDCFIKQVTRTLSMSC